MISHSHVFSFLHNRDLDELYLSFAIRSFAVSMISIFVPVYLLKLNYPITAVLFYFFLSYLIHGLFCIISAKLASRFGIKHIMIASLPFLIIFLLLLYTIPQYGWPLWLLAIIVGINMSLYWTGFHFDFCTFSDKTNRATEVGVVRLIMSSFRAIGPVVGGVIIAFLGFKILFIASCVFIILSGIPLFLSKDRCCVFDFSIKSIFSNWSIRDVTAYVSRGVERGIYTTIWPIIIFFSIAKSYTTLGGITTATLVLSLFFTFLISRAADKRRMLVYRLGCIINFFIWLLRTTLNTNLQVFFTDSVYGVSKTMYMIPFDANDYDKATKGNMIQHIIFREISIAFGFMLVFGVLCLLGNIDHSLYIAAGASLLLLVLKK